MKNKFFRVIKDNILFSTFIYLIPLVTLFFILKLFDLMFREWIYILSFIIIALGFFIGSIQLILKIKKKSIKIFFSIIFTIFCILIISLSPMIFLACVMIYQPEHIVERDGKKMVAYVEGFLDTSVSYYEYKNIFVVGASKKIEEYYGNGGFDPIENDSEYKFDVISTTYYDEKGKKILFHENNENFIEEVSNTENTILQDNIDEKKDGEYNEVLYEKQINDKIIIRIINKGYILAQRSVIEVDKTIDGGITWNNQLETADGFMQIYNGAEFIFIDENVGFINDPGIAGTNGENSGLLVTVNGGKTFQLSKIIKVRELEDRKLYIDEMPYKDENILKLKIHIIENSEKKYYDFYSEDNGITWKQI